MSSVSPQTPMHMSQLFTNPSPLIHTYRSSLPRYLRGLLSARLQLPLCHRFTTRPLTRILLYLRHRFVARLFTRLLHPLHHLFTATPPTRLLLSLRHRFAETPPTRLLLPLRHRLTSQDSSHFPLGFYSPAPSVHCKHRPIIHQG